MNALTIRAAGDAAELAALGALQPLSHPVAAEAQAETDEWWVAVDARGRIHGCARWRTAIGLATPRYWFHVGCVVHAAAELGLFHRQRTLLLGNDLTGCAELSDFAFAAEADVLAVGARLAGSALARATGTRLIVELPGLRDAQGRSPFWDGLGRHFYAGDPLAAAARHGALWRTHVAALLPRETLLVSFLPDSAQAAIGVASPAPEVQALLAALQPLGFRRSDYVAVDDAGPVLVAEPEASLTA